MPVIAYLNLRWPKIANGFILMLLIISAQTFIIDVFRGPEYISELFYYRQLIKCLTIHEYISQFWGQQICKYYQNIASILVFTIVFGIHFSFFMVLTILTHICRSLVLQSKICPMPDKLLRPINQAQPIGNLPRPDNVQLEDWLSCVVVFFIVVWVWWYIETLYI